MIHMKKFITHVEGVNLKSITKNELINIKKLISFYGLLIFKNQSMSDEDLVSFGKLLGNGELEQPARNLSLSSDRRYVAWLTNLTDVNNKSLGFSDNKTDYWHSDQEFRIKPASLSILYCEKINCSGGETSFASTNIKDVNIPNEKIEFLRSCWSTRRPASSHDNVPAIKVAHPVILSSESGDYIYISDNTIDIIFNKNVLKDSYDIKKAVIREVTSPEKIYSHSWSKGDLLLYDNVKLVHRREEFSGERFIKALKIYPDQKNNLQIPGVEINHE